MTPIEQPVRIHTEDIPLVTRWEQSDGPIYMVEFEDAGVSIRLGEAQVRGLGARILAATLDDTDYDAV